MLPYSLLADMVVLFHFGFILFAVFGALLAVKWKRVLWVHVPVVLWAGIVELMGFVCPLTPLENHLRLKAAQHGYSTGFIEHYLLPIIYPEGLTRPIQIFLGILVLGINAAVYLYLLRAYLLKGRVHSGNKD